MVNLLLIAGSTFLFSTSLGRKLLSIFCFYVLGSPYFWVLVLFGIKSILVGK